MKKHLIKRLWQYLYRFKGWLLLALILSIIANVLSLLGPMLAGRAIDAIAFEGGVQFEKVKLYCGLMIGFYIVSSLLTYLLSILMVSITQKIVIMLRKDVFNKLTELPVSYFDKMQTGDIISRISYDIDTIASSLSSDLIQICTSVITVIGSFVLMLTISPLLVLIFVVTIPISIFTTRYITKKVRPLFKKRSAKLGELNGFVEEIIAGHKTIKAYHAEEEIIARFDEKNEEAAEAYYQADYYGTLVGPSMNFINNISIAFVSIFGILLYLYKMISLGNVSSFTLYARKFSGPINEFANIINELQSSLAAAERVFRIIDEPSEQKDSIDAVEMHNVKGEVAMKDVNFSYEKNRLILKNINFVAGSGKTIAIVGPTGGGKTTIINLLMRFYETDSGLIFIDDNEIRNIKRKDLRSAYSMVLQDTWLFHGTIFENIAYAKSNATREEVISVAKVAKIDSYIESLPAGYDTLLDEEGMNISKGQKQLLTIARAMLSDAKMLILDEATSNVDTHTEMKIQEAMLGLMKGKTCFVIAHRLSTIIKADLILVVKDGEIIEQGKHIDLLEQDSYYAKLYNAQFE